MGDGFASFINIYRVEGLRDFFIFDGRQYCRFVLAGKQYRLVRRQAVLPARATGVAAGATRSEQQALAREAARCGVKLHFSRSFDACEQAALQEPSPLFVFDRQHPAAILGVYGFELLPKRGSSSSDD